MFVAEDMYQLGSQRSAIRELFEYGKQRAAVVGAENVYDFSLGNPTVPAPDCVNETIRDLTQAGFHFLARIYFCTGRYRDETGDRRLPEQDI